MGSALVGFCILFLFLGLPIILLFVLIRRVRRRRQREGASIIAPHQRAYYSLYGKPKECPVTIGLLVVLSLIYVCELIFSYGPVKDLSPSLLTLIAMGGVNHNLVYEDHEWYRLLTSAFLHLSPAHLLLNGIALFYAGTLLEKLIGPAWLLAVYFISAASGAVFSTLVNAPNLLSVGASGAIMGLFGVMLVTCLRLRPEEGGNGVLSLSLRVLIPSLLPSATSGHIDLGAHIGGAIAGVVCGFFLLPIWPSVATPPAFRAFAWGIAALGALLLAVGFGQAGAHYAYYGQFTQIAGHMIPDDEMPKTASERQARAAELVQKYPYDPRGHMYYATALLKTKDLAGAERESRLALADTEKLKVAFKKYNQMKNLEHAVLAFILAAEGKTAEARDEAKYPCAATGDDAVPALTLNKLMSNHLCDTTP